MDTKSLYKALFLTVSLGLSQQAMAQGEYFVTTQTAAASDTASVETSLSPEQQFLNKHFPFRSVCDWTKGMRFMVIPGEKDTYLNIFFDRNTDKEVSTGELKHHILIYQGYTITDRSWIQFNFDVFGSDQKVYHEVRNLSYAEYCQKISGGGVASLAYLDDVDVAKKELIGKELWTAHEIFYRDDASSRNGFREAPLPIDTKVKVTAVGVGTREYSVKIVVEDEKGNKYFQHCTMSHTNCGMNDNDFIAKNEQHLFDKAFSFKPKYKSATDRRKADPTKEFSALPRTGPSSPTNTKYVNFAGAVSGVVSKGETKDIVKLSKGAPDRTKKNRDGSVTWYYSDGTEITFSKKGIATRVKQ